MLEFRNRFVFPILLLVGWQDLSVIAQDNSTFSLDEILTQVQEFIPFRISFAQHLIPKEHRFVMPQFTTIGWRRTLTSLLDEAELDFRIIEENLIIYPKKKLLCHGFVFDDVTGESLPGAHISVPNRARGTVSNDEGYFQILLPIGPIEILVSYLGYESLPLKETLEEDLQINIRLKPSLELPEIVVNEATTTAGLQVEPAGNQNLPLSELSNLPGLGAGMDVFRYFQFIAGISAGSDGFGGIHVRGGGSDQNLFLLDDIPIYNPMHMLGAASIFNSSAIQSINVSKGFFNANEGGRLSSVVRVRLRDGDREKVSATAGLSGLSSHAVLEFPILQKKGTFMIGGQRSHAGQFIRKYSQRQKDENGVEGYFQPGFQDIYAKTFIELGRRDKVVANFYAGSDDLIDTEAFDFTAQDTLFRLSSRDQYNWGNLSTGMRWLHSFGKRVFAKTLVYFTTYKYESLSAVRWDADLNGSASLIDDIELTEFRSQISEKGIKTTLDIISGFYHQLSIGCSFSSFTYTPGIVAYDGGGIIAEEIFSKDQNISSLADELFDELSFSSRQWSLYFQDDWSISSSLRIRWGIHGNFFVNTPSKYFSMQPRISLRWSKGKSIFDLSFSLMRQPNHVVALDDNGLPNELWVPSTTDIAPEKSSMIDLTAAHQLGQFVRWTSSLYYKEMTNLIAFRDQPNYLSFGRLENVDASAWEQDVVRGQGRSWGLENSCRYDKQPYSLLLNYTYAKSFRKYHNKYYGYQFPYRYERPHEFSTVGQLVLHHRLRLGMTWQWGSGVAVPLTEGTYDLFSADDFFVESINVPGEELELLIMPAYHRLDLSAAYILARKKLHHEFKLSLLNVYNNPNITYPKIFQEEQGGSITFGTGLPFVPSLSYKMTFSDVK